MKIILLEDVRNIGKKNEVKEVNDGYARNFLFPNKLAESANSSSLKRLEAMKARAEKEDGILHKRLEAIAHTMAEMKLRFSLKVGDDGSVFGSINKEAILKALRDHGVITKEHVDLTLDRPLKALGEYVLPVDLKKGITTQLVVVVAKA
jgi:large subunit ribosomal protein L9